MQLEVDKRLEIKAIFLLDKPRFSLDFMLI